jgi:hypothetical protein
MAASIKQAHLSTVVDACVEVLDPELAGSHVEVDGDLDLIGLRGTAG